MASKSPIAEVAALLSHESADRRIAAAIVLGELKSKAPETIAGLVSMLESGSPPIQRPALEALARIASAKALGAMLPLLGAKDADVRSAAIEAVAAIGEDVVPKLRERLTASHGDERKAIDAALARFGDTRDAATALLAGLESSDPETARAVALAVRPKVKEADAKTRRMWTTEIGRILEKMRASPPSSPIPMASAVKILGYLEDDHAAPMLLAIVADARAPFAVRQEALIALRFAVGGSHADEVVNAMVAAAEAPDRLMAQTALMGLAAVELDDKHASRIARLAAHPDPERARIAIEKLKAQPGAQATAALVEVLTSRDRRRAETAAQALTTREDAAGAIARALIAEGDVDRANALRHALRPHTKALTAATRKKLVEVAVEKLAGGEGWQAHVDAAREADGKALATALEALVAKLARTKKEDLYRTVLGLLARSEHGSDEHRLKLASLLLQKSALDPLPAARAGDEGLAMLERLADAGVDVGSALEKDKALELAHLYYVGFHFAEQHHALGRELLEKVAKKGGRTKLGKMARNKLGLAAEDQ